MTTYTREELRELSKFISRWTYSGSPVEKVIDILNQLAEAEPLAWVHQKDLEFFKDSSTVGYAYSRQLDGRV